MADSIDTSFIAAEMERDSKFLQECNEFMSTITPIKRSREIEPDDSNTTDVTTEQIQKKQKFTDANVNVFELNYKIGLCFISMVYDVVIATRKCISY